MSSPQEGSKNIKDYITLGASELIGLFVLLLGIADLVFVNKSSLSSYYYGRGIATLLFGLAIMLYPFRSNRSAKLGGIALTVLAAYFVTMTYLYDSFYASGDLVDFILFTIIVRMYIPLSMKIEDEFHKTILDVIFGGILFFYALGVLVFPFTPAFGALKTGLALNGLVTTFVTFNAVDLTFLLLPANVLVVILRVRFIGGFIGLILATRNKELSIARLKVLKKLVVYIFLATLFIVFSYSAHYLHLYSRSESRAKIAVISYILYDLGFFIFVTYDLAEGLYKRC